MADLLTSQGALAPDATPTTVDPARERRMLLLGLAAYVAVRVAWVLASHPFVTPDTASYRSGQGTRPPVGAALLSWFGDQAFVVVSATVSSIGFAAVAWVLWSAARRRWSYGVLATLVLISFLPSVITYEHWLVPDSFLIGLGLISLALAWPREAPRWNAGALVTLAAIITCTKEIGVGVAVMVALVVLVRRSWKVAAPMVLVAALLFATVVVHSSDQHGAVLWNGPSDTELTMARFRVVVAGMAWPDLSSDLAAVHDRAGECGMNMTQLMLETFQVADHIVGFEDCPDLWPAVDRVGQLDVLLGHLRHPDHVQSTLERGFAADMNAMATWSDAAFSPSWWLSVDRLLTGLMSVLPLLAVAITVLLRRGRRLALVAVFGSCMALGAALVDPSSQDRHTIVFRVIAAAIALCALTDGTGRAAVAESLADEPADEPTPG